VMGGVEFDGLRIDRLVGRSKHKFVVYVDADRQVIAGLFLLKGEKPLEHRCQCLLHCSSWLSGIALSVSFVPNRNEEVRNDFKQNDMALNHDMDERLTTEPFRKGNEESFPTSKCNLSKEPSNSPSSRPGYIY
jgi:hypothetical protein